MEKREPVRLCVAAKQLTRLPECRDRSCEYRCVSVDGGFDKHGPIRARGVRSMLVYGIPTMWHRDVEQKHTVRLERLVYSFEQVSSRAAIVPGIERVIEYLANRCHCDARGDVG